MTYDSPTIIRTAALFTVTVLLSATAYAASSDALQAGRAACRQDVQHFCSDVQHGHGRIIQCLQQHSSELSEGCSQALQQRQASRAARGQQ